MSKNNVSLICGDDEHLNQEAQKCLRHAGYKVVRVSTIPSSEIREHLSQRLPMVRHIESRTYTKGIKDIRVLTGTRLGGNTGLYA